MMISLQLVADIMISWQREADMMNISWLTEVDCMNLTLVEATKMSHCYTASQS